MLFAGSKIAQTNVVGGEGVGDRVCAAVTDTGAETVKERLVKDILYPMRIVFVVLDHLKLVFGVLIIWGVLLLLASVGMLGGDSVRLYGMFTISQELTRLLPAVLVFGQSVADERLRTRGIL
jgi:magnesium-transporting ATPase (P-type)